MINAPTRQLSIAHYKAVMERVGGTDLRPVAERELALNDLFFLLVYVLGRKDINRDWIFARCREVEADPDGYLDLWAREHYKSTLITFGKTLQDILRNPEVTVGIFSFVRPIAKAFLRQIKREFESNDRLRAMFPDIVWENPHRDAPKWSEDDGIILKRRGNPKESTIEAWGLVDGQPTSKHYALMVYDDVVTASSVTTPEMIAKVTQAWETSLSLSQDGGKVRYIGTRWHHADTYQEIIRRGAAIERRHPVTVDGTAEGEPVLWTRAQVGQRRRDQGPYVFCLPSDAPILMADGSERFISEIKEGDVVVGYTIETAPERGRYVPSRVKASGCVGERELFLYTTEDNEQFLSTADHKWFTGRIDLKAGRSLYAPIGLADRYEGIKHVERMYRRRACPDERVAAWLGGIYDGEGCVSGKSIHISQSPEHNPVVCAAIEHSLAVLGFTYGTHERAAHTDDGRKNKAGRSYYLTDGRQTMVDFARWCRPAKAQAIMDRVMSGRGSNQIRVIAKESVGVFPVFGMETETGNYIAYGLLSKNSSQMLLDPTADRKQGFLDEWIRYYEDRSDFAGANKYLIVDAANAKKKSSDYTAIAVIGLGADENYYLVDAVRDRLSLRERGDAVFALHRRWRPQVVGYEQYGMMADVEYLRDRMADENYRFDIIELGGQLPKLDRIRRMVPIFEAGRFYLPDSLIKVDYEGRHVDLVPAFLNEEYRPFPVGLHDDMFDSISRIVEPDLNALWPKAKPEPLDRYARSRRRSRNHSAWAA